ncbi:hypothetical protein AC578_97 [Pseudocercospora eumusae]|uniref:Uncharacterized protein n=1 Tax=Pseudocercospora eumusae TaxID=321146 RepID=A0A139HNX1_9PEZI|nr:hypothetical protein AC578_97 [Pseudocercospora eumusae]
MPMLRSTAADADRRAQSLVQWSRALLHTLITGSDVIKSTLLREKKERSPELNEFKKRMAT